MNAHEAVLAFHDDCVKVPEGERRRLATARDRNLTRLVRGLDLIGGPRLAERPINQGGYATNTLTQREDGDQDLDVAIVFEEHDIPASPSRARDLVLEAVEETSPLFADPPERRTNAVTVWYAGGYHIDFAVYRRCRDRRGAWFEHAGGRWTASAPDDIRPWFTDLVRRRSPKGRRSGDVRDGQLRRVVRILKFLRQFDDDVYPGGIFIMALAAECYAPSDSGDDIALHRTLENVHRWLGSRRALANPVSGTRLDGRQTDQARLRRYRDLVGDVLVDLDGIHGARRNSYRVLEAWQEALEFEL